MNQATRLIIFNAQTINVHEIVKAQVQIKRAINFAIKRRDTVTEQALTKTLALIYCAWVEVNFSKMIHTPYGFTLDEIRQIKKIYKENGLESGWEKCLELGIRKIISSKKTNYLPNIHQELTRIIKKYIVEPSLLRNKVAHGQWKIALSEKILARIML